MAALRDIARDFATEIRDGIGWTIVYRTGRSWNALTIWSDIWNGEWETNDLNDAIGILKADPDAVIVNGYYCGHFGEDMTIDEIARSGRPRGGPQPHPALCFRGSGCGRRWRPMTAKCVGCGLDWNVSIYQKIPRTGYICPHCESRLRAGETLPNIQASQKARPQRTKGATL